MKTFLSWVGEGLFWTVLTIVVVVGVLYVSGCSVDHAPGPDPINVTGTHIDKADAHNESAETTVQKIKPEATEKGKALVDVVSSEHVAVAEELAQAKAELEHERAVKAAETKRADEAEAERDKLLHSWGHILQVWVEWAAWALVAAIAGHFLFGGLGLFVSGPLGATFAWIGGLLNPLAWFQMFRDNIHFRRQGC